MRHILLLIALTILLVSLSTLEAEAQDPEVQIGFTPFELYDAEVYGAPVFMSGEPLWLYTLEPSRANLLDPRGRIIASVLVDRRPTPIYTFSSADPPGRWTLEVRGQGFSSSYLVRLQKRFLDQVDLENGFELENQSLISRGTVRILSDETLEPHNLVLVRHPPAFFLRELHGG
ncbi:MAG: hypothetical protein HY619_04455, partial [Thaumarchaeota archaeon]|nr:hypothetical protein [Nitrososphaerota archaeon]